MPTTGTTGTAGTTGTGTELGAWKKYSINPAANRKWNTKIDPTKIKKNLDFRRAGRSQNIRTAPETKAAIRTKSHCNQVTWMVHSTATGM